MHISGSWIHLKTRIFQVFKYLNAISFFMLSACSLNLEIWGDGKTLSGKVLLPGISAFSICPSGDRKVYLYSLDNNGHINDTPIATADLDASYSFSFANITDSNSSLFLKADACGKHLSRPVTGAGEQNISYSTSLVGLIPYVQDPSVKKIQSIESQNIESTISALESISGVSTANSMSEVYDLLAATSTQKTAFASTFNLSDISKLISMVPPYIDTLSAPSSYQESSAATHNVTAAHWYGSYNAAFEWNLDGSQESASDTYVLTGDKNSQGAHTLNLKIGTDDGSGVIDTSFAVFEKQYHLNIQNTYPALPLVMARTSAAITNSSHVTLSLDTGATLANCETFSSFALSESSTSAGVTSSDFSRSCTTNTAQTESYTLSTGQGLKTIYLWTKDSAGNISATASSVTVTYDTTAPVLSLSGVPPVVGSSAMSLSFTATDATSSVAVLKLQYSSDGTTFSDAADLLAVSSPYTGYTASASGSLRLYAEDAAGNSSTTPPVAFTYDNTPPAAPGLTLTTAALTNNTVVGFTLANCTDTNQVLVTENTGAPSASSSSWTACSTSTTYNATISGDGTHTVYVWAKDAAGNISTTAGSVAVILDTTAPTIAWVAPTTDLKINTSTTVSWTVSDLHTSTAQNVVLEYSDDTGATWSTLSTQSLPAGSASGTAFNAAWTTASSLKLVTLRLTATDAAGNQKVTTKNLVVESERPVINSVTLADGASIVSISSINVALNVTPSTSATSYMRVSETDFDPNTDNGVGWMTYSAEKFSFILGTVAGNHTVYAQVKNNAGIMSLSNSYTVKLELVKPPTIKVTAPSGSGTYLPGQTMTISWQCQSSDAGVALAAKPISSIQYTIDDGLIYNLITDDTTSSLNATDSYNWVIPSQTPNGTAITSTTPIRVLVACKTEGGVITTALSMIQNSSWQVLIGDPGNLEYGVHISAADMSSWTSVYGDSQNNIYSGSRLRHAIIKIDRQSGILSEWLGGVNISGCPTSTQATFTIPRIIDISSDEMTIVSAPCHTITRVRISDKSILWNRTVSLIDWDDRTLTSYPTYDAYIKSGYYYFATFDGLNAKAWYEIDLNDTSSTPKLIIGNATTCTTTTPPAVSSVANTIALPCKTSSGNSMNGWIIPMPDRKTIYVYYRSGTASSNRLELTQDSSTLNYTVTSAPSSNETNLCSRAVYMGTDSSKLFCANNARSGNVLTYMDTATKSISATTVTLASTKITTDIQPTMGTSTNAIYTVSRETNELFETKFSNGTLTATKIGGNTFLTFGNGTDPALVAFTSIAGLAYDATNEILYTRGVRHLRRMKIDTSSTPKISQIDTAYPTLISTALNTYGGLIYDAINNVVAMNSTSSSLYTWASTTVASWANGAAPNLATISTLHSGTSGTATLGTAFAQGNNTIYDSGSTATYLSDGNFYFTGYTNTGLTDLWLYRSIPGAATGVLAFAGATGTPTATAYNSSGVTAIGAALLRVYGMQSACLRITAPCNDDLLVFDGNKLRKVTILTESGSPKIYDLADFSSFANFPSGKTWTEAIYDNRTGWSYLLTNDSTNKITEVYAARAAEGFIKIPTTGLNLPGTPPGNRGKAFYMQVTPLGLLVQDAYKRRILSTPLFN